MLPAHLIHCLCGKISRQHKAHQFYPEAITSGTKPMTTLNTKIKSAINADQSKAWLDHLKKLVAQGDLLKLAHSEESNLTWRNAIYTLTRRVLSFAINAYCVNRRHNCVLNHLEKYMRGLTNKANIISDLPGRSLSGLTIPPEVLVTPVRSCQPLF